MQSVSTRLDKADIARIALFVTKQQSNDRTAQVESAKTLAFGSCERSSIDSCIQGTPEDAYLLPRPLDMTVLANSAVLGALDADLMRLCARRNVIHPIRRYCGYTAVTENPIGQFVSGFFAPLGGRPPGRRPDGNMAPESS